MKTYVLCGSATAVLGSVTDKQDDEVTVRYVHKKVEAVETYKHHETFDFQEGQVYLFVPKRASSPCVLPLPQPFNNSLKLGATLLFQVDPAVDFANVWNDCCASSVTWQHSRPKKITDPLQKLGLPAKLTEYLREQVLYNGFEAPADSDVSEEDAEMGEDRLERNSSSTQSSSEQSCSDGDEDSEDYYTTLDEDDGEEDMEEEEEAEEEPEPEELLEDE
jgi:hypothetical protein